jgi:hypothetical protein
MTDTAQVRGEGSHPYQTHAERRSAIEPVIGHMKEDGRLGRNFLHNRHGDHLNAILAGVGQNGCCSGGSSACCASSWAGCSNPAHLAEPASPETVTPFSHGRLGCKERGRRRTTCCEPEPFQQVTPTDELNCRPARQATNEGCKPSATEIERTLPTHCRHRGAPSSRAKLLLQNKFSLIRSPDGSESVRNAG